jgi:hypothetical protein
VNGSTAVKKSDIRMPQSSMRTKSAGVMPLAMGDPQHFGDGAFYKLPVGRCGLSDIIHCPLYKALRFLKKKSRTSPTFPLRHFRSFPISLRISDHPAVQIVCTRIADYLDFPHSAEMLGHQSGQNCTVLRVPALDS